MAHYNVMVRTVSAVLLVAIVAVFGRVATQTFISYDDGIYVSSNPMVQKGLTAETVKWALTSVHGTLWHPITSLTYLIDVELFGVKPGAFKLVNVAFHAAASLLLLLFLFRATGQLWMSAIVAALFALHPTRVESVAWIAERKDVVSAFFWMLTLVLYERYARSPKAMRMGGVVVACACALMSKPSATTLPFALLLLDYWPLRRIEWPFDGRRIVKLVVEKLPLFALLVPAIVMTMRAQSSAIGTISLAARVANTILSYAAYLRMLLWPVNLGIFYPYRVSISTDNVAIAALFLIALTIVALRFARRLPFVAVGWLWFVGTMLPMAGLIQVGRQSMADRFTYIPYVGLFIAVVWLAKELAAQRPQLARALPAIAALVIVALATLTFVQVGYWKNSETIYAHTLDVTTKNAHAELALANTLLARRAAQEALPHFQAAAELEPKNSVAQSGIGASLALLGDTRAAEAALRKAVALDPADALAKRRLGELALSTGRTKDALQLLAPTQIGASDFVSQAELAMARGDIDAAILHYAAAIRQNGDNADLRNGYAAALARKGRNDEALAQYREALRVDPKHYDANMNIAALLSRNGADDEAAGHFRAAAEMRPRSPEPHVYLALLYAHMRRAAEAVAEVDAAATIDPIAANQFFTNAVRIPFKETNLQDFRAALASASGR